MTRSKSFIDELKASFDVGSNEDLTLVPPDYEKREFISKSPLMIVTKNGAMLKSLRRHFLYGQKIGLPR